MQMRSRVRADLGLTDSSLLTDSNLNDWLNEGQWELARRTRWYRTSETMGTTSGTKEYALPIPVAGRCIQIEEVHHNNESLCPVTLDQLLRWDDNYRQAGNGTPEYYYVRGSSGFGLHQTPDTTDTDNLLVIFVGMPPEVTADNDTFYMPHGLERGLIIYAKKLASEKDIYGEGGRRAQGYAAEWEQFLRDAQQQIDTVNEREVATLGGAALTDGYEPEIPYFRQVT